MAGTGPKLCKSPLELLTNDGSRKPPVFNKIWGYLIGGGLGFGGSVFATIAIRRPPFSGIQRTIAISIIGAFVGNYMNNVRNEAAAERDAVFRHYVELHPEDFPPYKRIKYSEVLEPWVPIVK
ncbi:hypothetical protein HHI36_011705 [Cryptolaemus montrouzieri]|uniref:NADH dehydrogenase [ubiquinone] 1 subunit C2 n=1 Tax=Cryptolaemus montrouzieri TaxID=559131 RepID=A0ABD2MML9_9CUCU